MSAVMERDTWAASGSSGGSSEPPPRESGSRRQGPTVVRTVIMWALLGFAMVALVVVAVPAVAGYRTLTVMSGSMEPTIHTGDMVVEREISPLDAHIGDIVTFRDPTNPSQLYTHRVRSIEVRDDGVHFRTKGDANNTVESWQVTADGAIGRVDYRLPGAGYALAWARTPVGRIGLVVIPAILLGVFELVRLWRPRRTEEGDGGPAG